MNTSLSVTERHEERQTAPVRQFHVLDWKPLLALFKQIQSFPSFDDFILAHTGLQANQIGVLIFLYAHRQSSEGTRTVYTQYICRFLNYLKLDFYDIHIKHVDIFLDKLLREKKSKNSIKLHLAAVRSFFRAMQAANKTLSNPAEFVKTPKLSRTDKIAHVLRKRLSLDTVDKILDHLEKNDSLRNTAIFYLLARTGLRVSELCNLRWEHLFFSGEKWALSVYGKGGKERIVFLPKNGEFYLLNYRLVEFGIKPSLTEHPAIAPLPIFSAYRRKDMPLQRRAINKMFEKLALATDTRHFSPHSLRHTCFTQLAHNKTPLSAIRLLAGHENITTTSIYLDAGEVMSSGALDFDSIDRPRTMP